MGLIYLMAQRTLIAPAGRPRAAGSPSPFDAMAAAAMGALAFGLGRTAWAWAGITEVYALNTALVAAILLLVVGGERPGGSEVGSAAGERPEMNLRASERRRMNPAGTRRGERPGGSGAGSAAGKRPEEEARRGSARRQDARRESARRFISGLVSGAG